MRILLVNKFHYRKGGAETYYFEIGRALKEMGHDVAYFSMKHPENLECAQDTFFVTQREYNNVKNPLIAIRDGAALAYSPEAKRKFQALCEEFRPDVVHLNNVHRQITLSILDAPYLSVNKVPVVYTAHDYVTVCPAYLMLDGERQVCEKCLVDGRYRHCVEGRCVKGSRAKSILAALEAFLNRSRGTNEKIDRVIAPSRFMASKLIEGGWPEEKITFLQNFVKDEALQKARSHDFNGTDCPYPYLLFFGRLSKEKGVDVLVKAFLRVADKLPQEWRLLIAGDGPERESIERLIRESSCVDRVIMTGHLDSEEMQRCVERATICVVSSRCRENMPYSVVEAFAAGTPVVASRIGGISELVEDGKTGFVCEPGDEDSMAEAIFRGVSFCSNDEAYLDLQKRCRDYVLANCDQDRFMDELTSLYEREINAKRA